MAVQKRYLHKRDAHGKTVTGPDGKPIFDRNAPRYRVMIAERDPVTRKRRNVTIGTYRTKRDAEDAEREALNRRDRGAALDPDTTTVGTLLERYMELEVPKTVAEPNRQEYRIIVDRHLKPAFGAVQARRLTALQVEELYADLRTRGYSTTTIKKCHLRLSAALRLARRWGIVERNICDDVRPPKLTYKESRIWTPAEARAFLAVASDDSLAALWRLLVETGMRTSEALGVTWGDFDPERGTLRIGAHVVRLVKGTPEVRTGGKTASAARSIHLTADAVASLNRERVTWNRKRLAAGADWHNPHELMFCGPAGRPLNARNVRRRFDRLAKAAGVTAITLHAVRKTSITSLIAGGANVKAVAARVGHRDPTTTIKTYTSLTTSMQDELGAIVNALMPPAESAGDTDPEKEA